MASRSGIWFLKELEKKLKRAVIIKSNSYEGTSIPSNKVASTTTGAGIFEYIRRKKVPSITEIFTKLIVFGSINEMSVMMNNVDPIMIPTAAALIPSSDRYTAAYFFRLFQIGKKKRTSNALGRNMAMVPI